MSSSTTTGTASTWTIDSSHSSVHFSVKHMVIATVRGQFDKVTGAVTLDPRQPGRSTVQASIDVSSISTGEPQRDAHLQSPDFLDAERFPTIEFRSTEVLPNDEGFTIKGSLTIHGVTRPVVLAVESSDMELKDPWGNLRRAATATTRINRKDYGLEWNVALEAGGFLVGDEIKIEIDVELVRQGDSA